MKSESLARSLPKQIRRPKPNPACPTWVVSTGPGKDSPRLSSVALAETYLHLPRINMTLRRIRPSARRQVAVKRCHRGSAASAIVLPWESFEKSITIQGSISCGGLGVPDNEDRNVCFCQCLGSRAPPRTRSEDYFEHSH